MSPASSRSRTGAGMVRFHVPSMHRAGCARAVTAALRRVDAQAEPRVDLERREGAADGAALAQALRAAGSEGQRLSA